MPAETLTDTSLMPYGKYKGKRMIDIPAKYFLYLLDNGMLSPGNVKDYVIDNLDGLKKEANIPR